MKVFVTGGSGFLGINLIRYLLKKGESVRSLDLVKFDYPEKDKIKAIVGDIRDASILDEATKGMDVIVHCAAALPLHSREEIFSTDVQGTKNVLKIAEKHRLKRVVHISSTAVYGIPDQCPICENDRLEGIDPYGEAKIAAEESCMEFRTRGMCVPVIRPASFIGPERLGIFALLYDWAKDGRGFPMIGNGKNSYQLLDVEDLCEAIYVCLTKDEKIVNDAFNVGAKKFTTMREDFQSVLDKAGFGKKVRGFPAWPIMVTLRFLKFLKLSPLCRWAYETAGQDYFISIAKAEKILGFTPKYSNRDALLRNYQWYLDNLSNFEGKSGISNRLPWKQGILKLAKKLF